MEKLQYDIQKRKRASTLLALASTEIDAAETLLEKELYREAVVHLYFASFYISNSLLCNRVPSNPSHKVIERGIHQVYGRVSDFPRRYIQLHKRLHQLRNEINYRSAHIPEPSKIKKDFKILNAYYKFARKVIPEVGYDEILRGIIEDNPKKVSDFSIDIYCPKTYAHHTRFTIWFPPFYLNIFNTRKLAAYSKDLLRRLKVKRSNEYVAGLNSKLDQYGDRHLLMFDIDSIDAEVEATLKEIGGILLKSGRGFHFIGRHVIENGKNWVKALRAILRNPVLKHRVDKKHIQISLERGYSTLRITTSKTKPYPPQFFKEFS
ncbi:MAG: HEPN domain-containing protein [Thermoproteota archaeon]